MTQRGTGSDSPRRGGKMPFCHLSSDRQVAGGGRRETAGSRQVLQAGIDGRSGPEALWAGHGLPVPPPQTSRSSVELFQGAVCQQGWPAASLPASLSHSRTTSSGAVGLSARRRSSIIADLQHFGDPVSLAARVPPTSAARAGRAGSSAVGASEAELPVWTQRGRFLQPAATRRVRRGFLTFF